MMDQHININDQNPVEEEFYHEDSFEEELEEFETYKIFKEKYDRAKEAQQDRNKMRRKIGKFRGSMIEQPGMKESLAFDEYFEDSQ